MSDRVPALVLGRGVTALGVIRDLGRQGLSVYLVGAHGNFAAASRYARAHPAAPNGDVPEATLEEFLERTGDRPMVLIPCSDAWTKAVSRLPGSLAHRFPASVPSAASVDDCVDKLRFSELLDRAELPHPTTLRIESAEDLDHVGAAAGVTYFLKPCQSQAFSGKYSVKAFQVASRAEAEGLWQRARDDGHAVLLQEYIPGPPTEHHFIDGFVDRRGRLCAAMARRRLRMHPPNFGNSTCSITVPLDEVRQAADDVARLVSVLSYRGAFSVELKRDPRDGVYKILELNARPWWYIHFANHCGLNISRMVYDDALGTPVEVVKDYKVGERCVFLRHDVRAAHRLIRGGEITAGRWLASLRGSSWPVFSWNDPRPYFADLAASLWSFLSGCGETR